MIRIVVTATAFLFFLQGVPAYAELLFGVTKYETLVSFDSESPGNLLSGVAISGLQNNESIVGIDFRPANNELYALRSTSRLYTIDINTGSATQVGAGPFSPPINGAKFGFDFNPLIDRIRLDSDVNANFVINPNDGTATRVNDLFYAIGDINQGRDPNVVHVAYDNNFNGTTSTQLYGIDTGLDVLVTQANSAGTLETVGSLPTNVSSIGGFDISGESGAGFLIVQAADESVSTLWTVDLASGAASRLGEIGGGLLITSFSVVIPTPVIPEPTTFGLTIAAMTFSMFRQRQ